MSDRTAKLQVVFWIALALAITPNTIDAFADPSPPWLRPTRFAASTLFLLAAVALAVSTVADRKRRQ